MLESCQFYENWHIQASLGRETENGYQPWRVTVNNKWWGSSGKRVPQPRHLELCLLLRAMHHGWRTHLPRGGWRLKIESTLSIQCQKARSVHEGSKFPANVMYNSKRHLNCTFYYVNQQETSRTKVWVEKRDCVPGLLQCIQGLLRIPHLQTQRLVLKFLRLPFWISSRDLLLSVTCV